MEAVGGQKHNIECTFWHSTQGSVHPSAASHNAIYPILETRPKVSISRNEQMQSKFSTLGNGI